MNFIYSVVVTIFLIHAASSTVLKGAGGSLQTPGFLDWSNGFQIVDSNSYGFSGDPVEIRYEGITQRNGVDRLVNGDVDFAGSDYHVFRTQDFAKRPSMVILPLFGANWGFSYNIPGLNSSHPNLVLTPKVM